MSMPARLRRLAFLAHRWLGIGGCVLMLLWFGSGIVMLYVGYPKLTPAERLARLPPLDPADCCVGLRALPPPADGAVLTSVRGRPAYVLGTRTYAGDTGAPEPATSPALALAAARAFSPGASPRLDGRIVEDRWTHSGGLNPHRPLYRVQVDAPEPATLYVSSATGQVVLDAPLAQQRWNYVGAWLHWLYLFRNRPADPVWTWLVIALSGACTLVAASGVLVGIWRWRFRGRYKSGSRSPYREPWMRWHHILGLVFSLCTCTWIFSGLMSMNPGGVFAAPAPAPDRVAYAGPAGDAPRPDDPRPVLAALRAAGFAPVELRWRRLGGESYVLAYDAHGDSRIVRAGPRGPRITRHWQPEEVLPAAAALFPGWRWRSTVLTDYDAYYYGRHEAAMNGGAPRGLPALRLAGDNGVLAYIDLRSGDPVLILSPSQRVGRWLFYFLHSWDLPPLLRAATLRDVLLILLSAGGILLSATGCVIGWRRLRTKAAARHPPGPRRA
ncbi:PepSY domain-containing protein [Achromobacter sp. Marseille-Q4962]|uniref:PepSY domain-containing protein n=1 Tax=Achromobacter sp. Marseille-Q4962 TaxID=2942202 RepID=UPI0020746C74|nr:PepSY domain-containing protein [Achromobacter sp. Marseille-Q4962]